MTDGRNGKHALVTGAASGIGLECARALPAVGVRVTLVDIAEDAVAGHAAEPGAEARPLVADVRVDAIAPGLVGTPSPSRGR